MLFLAVYRWFVDYFYDGSNKSVRMIPDLSLRPEEQPGSSTTVRSAVKRLTKKTSAADSFRATLANRRKIAGAAQEAPAEQQVEEGDAAAEEAGEDEGDAATQVFPGGVDRPTAMRTARNVKYNCFGKEWRGLYLSGTLPESLAWPSVTQTVQILHQLLEPTCNLTLDVGEAALGS